MKIKSKSLYLLDTEYILLPNFPPYKNLCRMMVRIILPPRQKEFPVVKYKLRMILCELYLIQIILNYFGAIED